MPDTEFSVTPCCGRQLDTAGTWDPTKTPVELLRSACRSQPTCSMASQAQLSSILTWGSVCRSSLWDKPKNARSNSSSSSSRINPSYGLANRPGPENPPMGRCPLPYRSVIGSWTISRLLSRVQKSESDRMPPGSRWLYPTMATPLSVCADVTPFSGVSAWQHLLHDRGTARRTPSAEPCSRLPLPDS